MVEGTGLDQNRRERFGTAAGGPERSEGEAHGRAEQNRQGHMNFRRGGRVVEGTGLENRQQGDLFVGSNPTLSATLRMQKAMGDCDRS